MVMAQYHLPGVSCSSKSSSSSSSFGSILDKPETNRTAAVTTTATGDFECNICLDNVQDPVVTLCGHLYCWPCIYRWIITSSPTNNDDEEEEEEEETPPPHCPVCKSHVSEKTLIPLYGRGTTAAKTSKHGVPRRPYSPAAAAFSHRRARRGSSNNGTAVGPPPGGMLFGEMVYARIFGNSETTLYSSSYPRVVMNPRQRRYMMEVDRSMSRLCFFLFCSFLLCLLLF